MLPAQYLLLLIAALCFIPCCGHINRHGHELHPKLSIQVYVCYLKIRPITVLKNDICIMKQIVLELLINWKQYFARFDR